MSMKKYINRLILAAASIMLGAGTAKAADVLTIGGSMTNATVKWYKSTSEPTAAPSGTTATTIAPGEWIIIEVTPNSGYWTYDDMLTIQPAGSIGGAEARPHRAIMVPKHPIALSGNEADGTGYYYLQIPAEWKNADGYTKVIVGGEAIAKIDLSAATVSGNTVTATTGAWTATITLDAVSYTYDGFAHEPEITDFSISDGTYSFTNTALHVSISGSGTNAGNYTASLASEDHGCLTGTGSVPFNITQSSGTINFEEPSITKSYGDAAFTPALLKFGDGSVTYSISPATGIATINASTGEVNIEGCGTATITATVADGPNFTYATKTATCTLTVNKAATTINVDPTLPNPFEMNVNDELMAGGLAALSPSAAGELVYTSGDATILQVSDGIIKALKEGTTNIKVSFPGNANYLAATDKYIPFTVSLNTATVSVDKETLDLFVGGTHAISATTSPSGLAVTYTADGSGVVSVDASGNVKALKEGTGTITVKVGGDGVYAENTKTITVTVSKISTTITVTYPNLELEVLDQVNSGAVLLPPEAGVLTYTSDKPAVAIVESSKIKALSEGTAVITVSYAGNNKYAAAESKTITVHVTKDLDENNIMLDIPTGGYVYDGTPKTPTVTVKDGDKTLTKGTDYNVSYSNNVNAGTATVTITDIEGGDYNVSGTKTFSIAKKPLTVTAKPKAITYGDAPTNDGVTYSGFVSGEDENTDGIFGTSTLSYDYDYTQYGNVGTYDITPKGLTAANYNITFSKGTLTVGQKTVGLTWVPNPASFTYSNSAKAPMAIATGMVNSDAISVTVAVSAKSGSSLTDGKAVNAGSYTATATGLTGDKAGNYKLPATTTQDFTISIAVNSFTAQPTITGWTYGDTPNDPSGAVAIFGTPVYKYSTTADGTYSETVPQNAGTYYVKAFVTSTNDYADAESEAVSFTIKKKALTVTAEDKTITFDAAPPTYTFTYAGFVNGESADVLTTKPTATCTYTAGSKVGTYPISASGAAAKNYQFTYVPGTLTVGTKSITGATVTTDPTIYVYDGTAKTPAVTVVLDGKTLVKGTDYDVEYTGNTAAGNATVTVTGKGNYAGTATGSFTIQSVKVSVSVVDLGSGEEIEGATVQVLYGEENLIDEWVSTTEPHEIDGLKAGVEYTLRETVAPEGYTIATDCTFTIDESGKVTSTGTITEDGVLLVENCKTHVEVSVVDIGSGEETEGATVQVLDGEGNVVEEWTSTTENHVIEGLKTGEEYTLKETVAPEGYVLSTKTTFTIAEDGKVTSTGTITEDGVLLVENCKTHVEVRVVDIANGEELEGATVQVLDGDGNVVEEWTSTTENHEIEGLKTGEEYTLKETVAPEGYVLSTKTTFTIAEDGKVTSTGTITEDGVLLVENSKTHVEVRVVDIANGEEIEGATVQVIDSQGNVVEEWVSATENHEIEGLKTGEEYTLKETVAPEGYTVATDITFTIDESGNVTSTGTITEDGVLLVENCKTHVEVSVVDIGSGEETEGATVQVIDSNGNVVEEWTSTTENHEIEGLKTGEEYTLKETVAPEGYTVATDITFTIDETGKITTTGSVTEDGVLLVENCKTHVEVSVVNIGSGEELEGATVQVIDSQGNVVEEWVSATENHEIEGLKTGEEYTLKETVAPEGYTVATDITFTIDESGNVTSTGTITEDGVLLVENTKIKELGTIELSQGEFTYDGVTHKPTVTVKDLDGNDIPEEQYTISYLDSKGNPVSDPTDADTYTVVITDKTGTGYDHYIVNGTATFVINKKVLTITAKDQSVNFGTAITQGTAHVTAEGLVTGHTLSSVTLTQSTTSVTTSGKIMPSNAVIKRVNTDVTANYDITYNEGTLIINASTAASAVVTANDREYDGTAKPLVTIGAIYNGETGTAADVVFYESATSTTPLTSIPEGTNAGTYEVFYEVKPDGDHTAPARAKVTVTITPITAIVTITGHNNTAVFNGSEHSVSGYDVKTSTPLYTEADFTFNGTATAKRTVTGMTTMGLNADQFTNDNMNFSTVTFNVTDGFQTIISPDIVIVTITGHSNTTDYDGTEHAVTGYKVEISNPLYKESDFTFTGAASATRTDAGKTMMGLDESLFTNTNTNFNTVKFNVTDGYQAISPIAAAVTITGHNNTTTYNNAEHSVTGYKVEISNPLYQETDFTFSGTASAARTEEGTTYMGLKEEQFENTSENFDPVTFTVIDGYQTITAVTDVVVTITGHSSTVDYDGTEHTVSGYEVEISNPLYKETDFTFSGTDEAALTDAGTKDMGLTSTQFKNINSDFSNVTFKVIDGYQTINPITVTVTIKGHSNMAVYDGTEHSVTGYDVTFSNDLYKQTDFIFSGSAGAAQTYKGTDYMGLSEGQFANTSPNFSKVTFTVIDGYQTITPRPLTITANEQAIEYGTDIATDLEKVTAVGLQGSDELSKITLTASLTASSKEITNDGTITPSNAKIMNGDADMTENYDITYNTGTLIIEYVMNLKAGYVTFCSPFDLMLTDGMKAYTVSDVSEAQGVVLDEQNAIGKNVPMILNIETAGTYKLRKTDPQNFSSVPEFIGVTDANGTDVNTIAGDVYILKDGKFVWSREGIVPQYRCYAVINNAAGARSLSIIVDNESNGIDNLLWSDEEEGNWYSLDGQKLDGKPTAKGLYIMIPANGRSKGKKVMIK